MWMSLGEYILSQCVNTPTKIVEVGVGKYTGVFEFLEKQDNVEIIKTDIQPDDSSVIKDDVCNPNMEIYKNTDIIYSIRPPSELQPCLVKLANKINAHLIIKPLFNEDLNTGPNKMTLKNFKKASFYVLR